MQNVGSSNLDIPGIKIAGKNLAGVTGANLGEGRKGGFMQIRDERIEKRQKRAKELEVNEYSPLKKDLKEKELAQQVILNENKSALDKAAKDIEDKRQQMNDTVDPKEKESRGKELQKLKDELKADKERIGLPAIEKEISTAKKVIEKENIDRANDFANSLGTPLSKVIDHITGLGQYSTQGLEEAQYKIKMRLAVAANSGGDKGGHGGGSHGGGSPKPTPPPPKPKPADDHDEHEHSGGGGEHHH